MIEASSDVETYLRAQERRTLLRFITCGSVDDGKSTLIGRLLYDSKMVFEDQLAALAVDSKKVGTRGGDLDFALLVDGLSAEREQGITIDVAYRFFSTDKRHFIVADTPGHEQYTRNMVTGASTADLAVILIDARKGVLTQTRRHSFIVSLLGIRQVVAAINKMDLVDYSRERVRSDPARLRRVRGTHRPDRRDLHSRVGDSWPQHRGPRAGDALVRGSDPLRASRERRGRGPRSVAPVSPAGAVGQSARCHVSRIRRADRERHRSYWAIRSESCRPAARAGSPGFWSATGMSTRRSPDSP